MALDWDGLDRADPEELTKVICTRSAAPTRRCRSFEDDGVTGRVGNMPSTGGATPSISSTAAERSTPTRRTKPTTGVMPTTRITARATWASAASSATARTSTRASIVWRPICGGKFSRRRPMPREMAKAHVQSQIGLLLDQERREDVGVEAVAEVVGVVTPLPVMSR